MEAYQKLEKIGEGTYGVVYEAWWQATLAKKGLRHFAESGDCASALALLEAHPELKVDQRSFIDSRGVSTALQAAAVGGHCDMVALLLARGADPNAIRYTIDRSAITIHEDRSALTDTPSPGVAMLLLGAGASARCFFVGSGWPTGDTALPWLRTAPAVLAAVHGFAHLPLLRAVRRLLLASCAGSLGVPEDLQLSVLDAMRARRPDAAADATLLQRAQQQGVRRGALAHASPAFGLDVFGLDVLQSCARESARREATAEHEQRAAEEQRRRWQRKLEQEAEDQTRRLWAEKPRFSAPRVKQAGRAAVARNMRAAHRIQQPRRRM